MRFAPTRGALVLPALALLLAGAPGRGAALDSQDDGKREERKQGGGAQHGGEAEGPDLKPGAPSLDFELLEAPKQKGDPDLQRKIDARRTMLTLHQGLGIATLAALTATVVVGQLDFDDRFRGGGDTGRYHGWHRGLAAGSSALFLGTGLLALLAPEPYEKPLRLDTALLHRVAMGTAAAGMVAELVLGVVARNRTGSLAERQLATAHQIVGYTTLGAMTVGVTVLFF